MKKLLVDIAYITIASIAFLGCSTNYVLNETKDIHVVIESYIQPDLLDNLDVLVSLDTSCSMNNDQVTVAAGLDILTNSLSEITHDFQIGIINDISMQPDYAGPYDSSHTQIDYILGMGLLRASSTESGFAGSAGFLSSAATSLFSVYTPSGVDPVIHSFPFVREGVPLLIFLISDEEEQSNINTQVYHDWLISMKPADAVDVVTIAALDDECGPTIGQKFIDLSSLFGKQSLDLCNDDWENWLFESSFLTRRQNSVELTETPVPGTIVVYVDNVEDDRWFYDDNTNIVWLEYTPDAMSLVEVGYDAYNE